MSNIQPWQHLTLAFYANVDGMDINIGRSVSIMIGKNPTQNMIVNLIDQAVRFELPKAKRGAKKVTWVFSIQPQPVNHWLDFPTLDYR